MEQNCSSTVFRDPDGEQCDSLLDWKMKTCFYPLHGTLANDRTLRSSKELNSCQVSGLEPENLQAPFPGILKARAEALCCRAYFASGYVPVAYGDNVLKYGRRFNAQLEGG